MALDKRTREQLHAHCGELHDDDGVDPREFFKAGRGSRKPDHKTKQLCRQTAETLDQVLAGESADPRLACLRVVAVQPAPDSSRLLVTVLADCLREDFDREESTARLQASAGRFRAALAAAITRRKTPTLAFLLLGPEQGPEERKVGHD